MELCYQCFQEFDGDICPYCGYDAEKNREKYPRALPHGTALGGRYIVGKVLGQGGFGITYIAYDYQEQQLVAVKEYFPDSLASREDRTTVSPFSGEKGEAFAYGKECFLKEAETLSQFIGHRSIVRVFSYFEENNTAYFAMEYIVGASLLDYIAQRGGSLSFEETEGVLLPVMVALSQIHEKGFIHRDIAPDNIILQSNGEPKLIDFGAARYSLGDRSLSFDIVLKHGYAPKEQYARHGRQGPFTDIYAMGATIYKCLTGRTPPDAIDRTDEDTLIPLDVMGVRLPYQAQDAIMRAMAISSSDRFQSMSEFRAALTAGDVREEPKDPAKSYVAAEIQEGRYSLDDSAPREGGEDLAADSQKDSFSQKSSQIDKINHNRMRWLYIAAPAVVLAAIVLLVIFLPRGGRVTEELTVTEATASPFNNNTSFTPDVIWERITSTESPEEPAETAGEGEKASPTQGEEAKEEPLSFSGETSLIDTGIYHSVGLMKDGKVVISGGNKDGQCDVSDWTDIIAISTGTDHTVGLKKDGTVVAVGSQDHGRCDVSDWTDIVAVSAGDWHTVGLKKDGTVVAVGSNSSARCNVYNWKEIVAISGGGEHTVALKSNGTAVAIGRNNSGQCNVSSWADLASISAGGYHTVGLKNDGTVVAVGFNGDGECDVSDWTDIIAVSAGDFYTVGLKKDGTVVATGYNKDGRCDVSGWKDIVAISAGRNHTLGLKRDGTVVAVGNNDNSQCDVGSWKLN